MQDTVKQLLLINEEEFINLIVYNITQLYLDVTSSVRV